MSVGNLKLDQLVKESDTINSNESFSAYLSKIFINLNNQISKLPTTTKKEIRIKSALTLALEKAQKDINSKFQAEVKKLVLAITTHHNIVDAVDPTGINNSLNTEYMRHNAHQ
jgi:hypothetical protein